MPSTSDTPEWWEDVFTPHEINDLQRATEEVINNNPDDRIDTFLLAEVMGIEYVEVELLLPVGQLPSILKGLRDATRYTKGDMDWQEFIHMLGATLAIQYLESDSPYDEQVTDLATWFLPDEE